MHLVQTVLETIKKQVREQDQVGSLVVDKVGTLMTTVMSTRSTITIYKARGLESMKDSVTNFMKHYNRNMPLFHSKLREIEKGGKQPRWDAPLNNAFREELDSLKVDVISVRDLIQEPNDPSNTMDIDNSDLNSQVHNLLEQMESVERCISNNKLHVGGDSFGSKAKVHVWAETRCTKSCGFFWDLCSVLVVMKPKQHSGQDRADEVYSAQ
jgi:hypothetical protein